MNAQSSSTSSDADTQLSGEVMDDLFSPINNVKHQWNSLEDDENTFTIKYYDQRAIENLHPNMNDEFTLTYQPVDSGDNTSDDEDGLDDAEVFEKVEPATAITVTPPEDNDDEFRSSFTSNSFRLKSQSGFKNQKPTLNRDLFFCIFLFMDDIIDMIKLSRTCQDAYLSWRHPYLWKCEQNNIKLRSLTTPSQQKESSNNSLEPLSNIYVYSRLLMEHKIERVKLDEEKRLEQKRSERYALEKIKAKELDNIWLYYFILIGLASFFAVFNDNIRTFLYFIGFIVQSLSFLITTVLGVFVYRTNNVFILVSAVLLVIILNLWLSEFLLIDRKSVV